MKSHFPRTTGYLLTVVLFLFLANRDVAAQSGADVSGQVTNESEIADANRLSQEIVHFHALLQRMPAILTSDSSPVLKELAVNAMREFKYTEGISALVKNLVVVRKTCRFGSDMVPHIQSYACALALYDFGQVSVDPLMTLISQSHDELEVKVAAYTIANILGQDAAVQRFTTSLIATHDPDEQKNLDVAIEVVQSSD